jgi:hypothetical protein
MMQKRKYEENAEDEEIKTLKKMRNMKKKIKTKMLGSNQGSILGRDWDDHWKRWS